MRKYSRKIKTFAAVSLAAVLAGTIPGMAMAETETETGFKVPKVVNIGVQTLITPELIAREEGIYEDNLGTKVNLVQFDSGADVNKAFSSGSLDIAAIGTSPVSIGISKDLGYEVFWYHDVIGTAESLAVRNEAGISTVQDLVGKKVATPFASTAHYSLLSLLEKENVPVDQIELLDMQPDDIYAAWKRGDIDAAYVWNPVLAELKADDGTVIADSGQLAKEGIVTADLAAVRKEFAEEYPDAVTGYVKAQLYALDVLKNDPETAVKEIAQAAGISEEDAESQTHDFEYPDGETQVSADYLGTAGNPGALADTLKKTADFLVEQKSIDQAPDLAAFQDSVTGEFVEAALK